MTPTPQPTEAFDAVDIIRIKRDKGVLSPAQIDWTIDAYTRGAIADEQMAALNMAILLNGMDRAEISRWTAAMIASGERMDFSSLRRPDGGVKPTSPTSTPPAEWGTRSPCRWHPWWRSSALPCRSSPAAASATPAAPWTSSKRSRAGARH